MVIRKHKGYPDPPAFKCRSASTHCISHYWWCLTFKFRQAIRLNVKTRPISAGLRSLVNWVVFSHFSTPSLQSAVKWQFTCRNKNKALFRFVLFHRIYLIPFNLIWFLIILSQRNSLSTFHTSLHSFIWICIYMTYGMLIVQYSLSIQMNGSVSTSSL